MLYGLSQDTIVTMKAIVDGVTFSSFTTYESQGTATTINVSVKTSPFNEDDTTVGVYIRPVDAESPPHTIGDFQRKYEEYFWLYCQAPKKSTLATIVSEVVSYLHSKRKDSTRTGAQAEIKFIDVMGERDISDPSTTPNKFCKAVIVRFVWFVSLGA